MTAPATARTRWLGATTLALSLVIGFSGTANAYYVSSETGLLGPYYLDDTSGSPGVICNYLRASHDTYLMNWMKVRPPTVRAADRNSDRRDTRIVSWRFVLVRNVGPGFQVVATSPVQKARAYEDQPAAFSAMKVYHRAATISEQFQARVTIKWHKRDGSVEGTAVLWMQFYGVKNSPFVNEDYCPGGRQLE